MNRARIRVFGTEPAGLGTAVQWRTNGDHPLDLVGQWLDDPIGGQPYQRVEGAVVRYYRHPGVAGERICPTCGDRMHIHGWIDKPNLLVHPGDWVTIPDHGVGAFNPLTLIDQMERCVETMQALKPIRLWWKNDGQDIRLGTGFHQEIPSKGSLLAFPCDHGVVWRVAGLYFGLVAEGSHTWRAWRDGRPHEGGGIDVFVEQAEGPYEP